MILLDTNVLIYASEGRSKLGRWSRQLIADAVSDEGRFKTYFPKVTLRTPAP